ncbi:MAG TPA: hypothetical protein VFR58_17990 [Flavisolibacter sp.]|nr:hypothetical protein [Flavisolibacter sp.]
MKPIKGGKDRNEQDPVRSGHLQKAGDGEAEQLGNSLVELVRAHAGDSTDREQWEALLSIAVMAWNTGSMKKSSPDTYRAMLEEAQMDLEDDAASFELLRKMLRDREQRFAQDDSFIRDYRLEEGARGFRVWVQPVDMDELESEESEAEQHAMEGFYDDWSEGYINRTALTVRPRQVYLDWINAQTPGEPPIAGFDEHNIYLVPEAETNEAVELWLKQNFGRLFERELESWSTDEHTWPARRDYRLFREWFQVEVSTMVFDMEPTPLRKEI